MREIKFRWWNGQQMITGKNLCVLAKNLKGGVHDQFTGLYDCNGKEIYEGDVVQIAGQPDFTGSDDWTVEQWEDPPKHPPKRDVVELSRHRLWLRNESFGYEGEELVSPKNCEVIGNCHEHPSLLEEKE